MKRTRLNKKSKSPVAQAKDRIQALCRAIAIKRDGGCILEPYQGKDGIPYCNGYTRDGDLILQFDHLHSRINNISFGEPRLGVTVCKGHHTWKTFRAKEPYDELVRTIIGPERCKLWDRVKKDTRPYHMTEYDWGNLELGLKQELADLTKTC